jgi:ABC-type multidrug transport system fused ATPase/permease subunit
MWPYLRQVAGLVTVGSAAGVVMNTAVVLPAVFLGRAVDTALAVDRGRASAGELARAAALVVAAAVGTELPRIGKRWWLGVARARVRATVRADALRGVLDWTADRLHRTPIGEVMARIVGDVEVLGTGLGEIIVETWDTLLFSASLIVAMCLYDVRLAVLALLPVPLALVLAKVSGRWVTRRTLAARTANAALTGYISEHLTGLRVIRAFARAEAVTAALGGLADRQADAELSATRLGAWLQPVYATLTTAGVVAVLWLGAGRVTAGAMSVGALVAFLQLFVRFTARAYRIPQMANRVQAARAAYGRLAPLLAPAATATSRWSSWRTTRIVGPPSPPAATGRGDTRPAAVLLDRVDFRYPGAGQAALSGVSLTVEAGTMLAVTGPVGSGKSALAAVIAGLYPVAGGRVLVDGRDPHTWTPTDRDILGYLPQGDPVFSGTVADNITLTRTDHDHRMRAALRVAGLEPDLDSWPEGVLTEIGERGVQISGGQRQRIALARALAAPGRPPRLLVLDDPFSAVDVVTEAHIVAALREYAGPAAPAEHRATIVLCSTRLAAFPSADHIVVLDAGRIVEGGRHHDLLDAGGRYARIYRAQQRIHRPVPAARR